MKKKLIYFFPITIILIALSLSFQKSTPTEDLPQLSKKEIAAYKWADSILEEMTLDEKIGQLFMIDVDSSEHEKHIKFIEYLINKFHIGGVIFFKSYPTHQAKLTNHFQKLSKTPLFVAIDGEWGINMRLDSILPFPRQMTLGSIKEDSLIYQMGKEVAHQCNRMGIHINFAPVVDINNNPNNPVINFRSFGEDKKQVAEKANAYMKGMQDNGIIAVAKHFPGHGDTDIDSHKDLPVITHGLKRLLHTELYPFRKLIKDGVKGVMIAHLHIPALDDNENLPSTLSKKIVNDLLIERMNFNGLIFTDALNMKGVTKYYEHGEIEVRALQAGNDILLYPGDIPVAFEAIKTAIDSNVISEELIHEKARKILKEKYLVGLNHLKPVKVSNIVEDLNNINSKILVRNLIKASITLVKNNDGLIPFKQLNNKNFASLAIGETEENTFQKVLDKYDEIAKFQISKFAPKSKYHSIKEKLEKHSTIIISLHKLSYYNTNTYGLTNNVTTLINELAEYKDVILVNFGSPYALKYFEGIETIIQVSEDFEASQEIAAQAIFGGQLFLGNLQITPTSEFELFQGEIISEKTRLSYVYPEELNINSKDLSKINDLVNNAISKKAIPGCQILIAKEGNIFFNKSFGYQTYEKEKEIVNSNIYDLASITKVASTLMGVMRFYDIKRFKLKDVVEDYIEETNGYDVGTVTTKELLMHDGGLPAWIPFYKSFMTNGKPDPTYFSGTENPLYPYRVSKNLFSNQLAVDSVWSKIYHSVLKSRGTYKYSDLDFLLLQKIVENLSEQPLDVFVTNNFYKPLGMNNTCYNPYKCFPLENIPPTENDDYFRKEKIQGFVHDPAAALIGGVGGHAGLFSNTNDMAKYAQMLLNNGTYGGEMYFSKNTVNQFTRKSSSSNRRGLGFDKPETTPGKATPTGKYVSPSTFGHTGFTGTCIWIDPEYNLIYIFISNRTYPTSSNRKLISMNVRTDIQDVIYEVLLK